MILCGPCVCVSRGRRCQILGAGVTGNCDPLNVSAANWTRVFWRTTNAFYLLCLHSSSHMLYFYCVAPMSESYRLSYRINESHLYFSHARSGYREGGCCLSGLQSLFWQLAMCRNRHTRNIVCFYSSVKRSAIFPSSPTDPTCWWPYSSSCSGVPKALSACGFQFSLQLDVIDCSLLYKSIYWHMSDISFTYRFLFLWAANYNGWGSVCRKIPQIKLYIFSTEISKCGASIKVFSTHALCISFSLLKGENRLCCSPSLRQPVKEGAIQVQWRKKQRK